MKSLKYIKWSIGLILLFLYNACTFSTGEVTSLLSRAEALTWSDPDSALTILRSIPSPNKLSGWEQANYALLISKKQLIMLIGI